MADISSVTNYFPIHKEGFVTTVGVGGVTSGGTTVPLTTTSGLTNGDVFVGLVKPGEDGEQCFTGIVDTSGSQITGVKWTTGSNQDHAAGSTIVDYVTSTSQNMQSTGVLVEHNQDGTHSDITATSITTDSLTITGSADAEGWAAVGNTVEFTSNDGNKQATYTISGVDKTGTLQEGMKIKLPRVTAPPTTSFSLDGSNDYYNDTSVNGMTFTDDFSVSAWVYLTAYQQGYIASRYNGTSGWEFRVDATGSIAMLGRNAGSGNFSRLSSYQSIPLNKWVHIAAQLDMSAFTATTTTSYIMIDGVDVPAAVDRGGSNPTTLVQAGNLEIGSVNGGTNPFPGYIDQVAIYSAKVTQADHLARMCGELTGSETNLISAYSDGSTTDLNTTNANNLTAQNGATTVTDSPFSSNEYGIITSVSFSTDTTLTVFHGSGVPVNENVTAPAYSIARTPYGFPADRGKWQIDTIIKSPLRQSSASSGVVYNPGGLTIKFPVGAWLYQHKVYISVNGSTDSEKDIAMALSTSPSSFSSGTEYLTYSYAYQQGTLAKNVISCPEIYFYEPTGASYYAAVGANGSATLTLVGFGGLSIMSVRCAYI